MAVGRASYRQRFPQADQILLEPDRDDERLFFTNVFRYAGRRRLAEHAYQCTRRDLLRQASGLRRLLKRHGLGLDLKVLKDRHRSLDTAMRRRRTQTSDATLKLDSALNRLEGIVSPARRRR
jgi:hypothetical protein